MLLGLLIVEFVEGTTVEGTDDDDPSPRVFNKKYV